MPLTQPQKKELKNFVQRIEAVRAQKAELTEDEKAIFAAAKAKGLNVKAIWRVLALRKQDDHERLEFASVVDDYCHALGMQLQLDLLEAAE